MIMLLLWSGHKLSTYELSVIKILLCLFFVFPQGIPVTQLGTKTNPWQVTASIRTGSGSVYGDLIGNITLPFVDGWVNFTDIAVNNANSDYILDFEITYPNASTLAVSSQSFDVDAKDYYAAVVTAPDVVYVSGSFDVVVEIRDPDTMVAVNYLAEKVGCYLVTGNR